MSVTIQERKHGLAVAKANSVLVLTDIQAETSHLLAGINAQTVDWRDTYLRMQRLARSIEVLKSVTETLERIHKV